MNTFRIFALATATLFTAFAWAADATVTLVNGTAGTVVKEKIIKAQPGQQLADGIVLASAEDGSLRVKLADGGSLVLGPNSRVVVAGSDITLVRGLVLGDFAVGTSIRTAAGIIAAGGAKVGVEYRNGALAVATGDSIQFSGGVSTKGDKTAPGEVTVKPVGGAKPIKVEPSKMVTLKAGTPEHGKVSKVQLTEITTASPTLRLLSRTADAATTPTAPGAAPDLSKLTDISPGGV